MHVLDSCLLAPSLFHFTLPTPTMTEWNSLKMLAGVCNIECCFTKGSQLLTSAWSEIYFSGFGGWVGYTVVVSYLGEFNAELRMYFHSAKPVSLLQVFYCMCTRLMVFSSDDEVNIQ